MKTRLIELAAASGALVAGKQVKEFGFFTKQRPQYENGQFEGMGAEFSPLNTAKTAVGAAAVGGAGYGGVLAHRAIQGEFGGQGANSYRQAGNFAAQTAENIPAAFGAAKGRAATAWRRTAGKGFLGRVGSAAKAGLRAGRRVLGFSEGSSVKGRLKELAVVSGNVKEFFVNAKGQNSDDNWKRGLLLGGVYNLPNAQEASDANVVYRKRDAISDAVKTQGGILGGAVAGTAAGISPELLKMARGTKATVTGTATGVKRATRVRQGFRMSDATMVRGGAGMAAGALAGLGGGYLWARRANRKRIEAAKAGGQV
jgi:hypothetical protein